MRRTIGLVDWETHLRGLAASAVEAVVAGAPEGFLLWSGGARSGEVAAGAELDAALWWTVLDEALDPLGLIEPASDGPLFMQGSSRTIEVWTERELCGMHAMWWAAELRGSEGMRERLGACARWHVENTQPDNATNRPWAAHVFLLIAERDEDAGARLYAETLIHNCQTNLGVPDALSGLILDDCAAGLGRVLRG